MFSPTVVRCCLLLLTTAVCSANGLGQDEPAADQPAKVKKSQLIEIAQARVEQHEQRLKAIRALAKLRQEINEVHLRQVKSQADSIKAELNAAEVLNEQQQRELARIKALVEKAAVSRAELSEMETQVATSVARLAHVRSKLRHAEAEIQAATLELEQSKWEAVLQEAEATIELLDAKAALVELLGE